LQWHEDTLDIPSAGKRIATSKAVPHQAFLYGENTYGLQFHLEVTEEMIREWMKTYKEELNGSQTPLLAKLKILSDTERKMGAYKKRGMRFFENFLRQTLNH